MNFTQNGDSMCIESLHQSEDNSIKRTQYKMQQFQKHSESNGENQKNVPVYGHLVTAEQLNQIEQQKIIHNNLSNDFQRRKLAESLDQTNISSDYANQLFQVVNTNLYEVESHKPHQNVPYYSYPLFNPSEDTNLKPKPQKTNDCAQNEELYENASQSFSNSATHHISTLHPSNHPLIKLSVDLITTYKLINENYYQKKKQREFEFDKRKLFTGPIDDGKSKRDKKHTFADPNASDNSEVPGIKHAHHLPHHYQNIGHHHNHQHYQHCHHHKIPEVSSFATGTVENNFEYLVRKGEIWKNRYCIEQSIGTGSFGQVVKAKDMVTQECVAIKIIKNKRTFVEQAQMEIELLKEMSKYQETDEMAQKWGANYIVKLKATFTHHGHLCLVFELLTYNLYDLLKNTNFKGVSLNLTRKFGNQLCEALSFLSRPQLQIIHCDLKPENILLIHPRRSAIKVIDFGSSCRQNERIYCYIQSRFYRSPEVILNLEYGSAIDIWSLGCILVELHTGQPLFIGHHEHEQMLRIVELMGMPPNHMLVKGKKTNKYFSLTNSENDVISYQPKIYRDRDNKKIDFKGISSRSLTDILGVYAGGPMGRRKDEAGHSAADYESFHDLLQKMLVLDPDRRIKPVDALKHPFFVKSQSRAESSNQPQTIANGLTHLCVEKANVIDVCSEKVHPEATQTYLTYMGSSQDCINTATDICSTIVKEPEKSEHI